MIKTKMISAPAVVDKLGKIKAQIAKLHETEAELKADLVASGLHEVNGELYRATVSRSEVKVTDWRAVVEGLEQTPALRRRGTVHTNISDRVTVRIVSR